MGRTGGARACMVVCMPPTPPRAEAVGCPVQGGCAACSWTPDPKRCSVKVKTAEFHTIVTRHLEWFKRKNMRQTIGRPAPVPNPMSFLFEPLLVKIYTQICARLHRDSAAPFGIRSQALVHEEGHDAAQQGC